MGQGGGSFPEKLEEALKKGEQVVLEILG
jgi:hypothetical protein